MKRAGFAVLAWLLPGGGYLLLRRYGRFAAWLALVSAAAIAGLMLQGGNLWPDPAELQGLDGVATLLARAGALAKAAAGAPYVLARMAGYAQPYIAGCVHEYGTALLTIAGLINLLAIADAWELRRAEDRA